ncbi:TolC family protein [Polymorphobacter sp.]|uniref:TolC family protein n=1 Tax=Polymorphobacter sp. TaxID=1909290 RepID=UPI003F70233F
MRLMILLMVGLAAPALASPGERTRDDPRGLIPGAQPNTAGACVPGAAPLTLAEAVSVALCRHPRTAAAWAAAQAAAAQSGTARGALLPQVDAQIGPTLNRSQSFRGTGFVDGNGQFIGGGASTTTNTTTAVQLGLSWLILDGGARAGRIAAADANAEALSAQFVDETQAVVLEVVQAWNLLVANRAIEAANLANLEFARLSRDLAAGRASVGVATGADRLQGETQAAQAELTLTQTRGNVATAAARLAVAMGLPPATALALAPLPPLERPVVGGGADALIAEAERLRPDLRAQRAQVRVAEANERVARSAGRPSLALQATNGLSALDTSIDRNLSSVGLAVSIPLFSGWNTRYSIAQARAQRAQQAAVLEQVRQAAGLAVYQQYVSLENAVASLVPARALVASADESAALAQGRYRAGVGTFVELLNAQSALATARQQLVQAEFNVRTAQAELARAVGDMDGFQEDGFRGDER